MRKQYLFLYKGWKNVIFGIKKGWKNANFRAETGWKNAIYNMASLEVCYYKDGDERCYTEKLNQN